MNEQLSNAIFMVLLQVGFTKLFVLLQILVVSYTTVSPLPIFLLAVYFLLHYPADCSGWALPTTLLFGVRTFLGAQKLIKPLCYAVTQTTLHHKL